MPTNSIEFSVGIRQHQRRYQKGGIAVASKYVSSFWTHQERHTPPNTNTYLDTYQLPVPGILKPILTVRRTCRDVVSHGVRMTLQRTLNASGIACNLRDQPRILRASPLSTTNPPKRDLVPPPARTS
ncbi:hypothetical protein AB1N83_012089 [Pleurotus pulmonarius]